MRCGGVPLKSRSNRFISVRPRTSFCNDRTSFTYDKQLSFFPSLPVSTGSWTSSGICLFPSCSSQVFLFGGFVFESAKTYLVTLEVIQSVSIKGLNLGGCRMSAEHHLRVKLFLVSEGCGRDTAAFLFQYHQKALTTWTKWFGIQFLVTWITYRKHNTQVQRECVRSP